jgi:hypothetical protein
MTAGYDHLLEVHAEGDVVWGPDPADVADLTGVLAEAGGTPGEQARAALAWMHEREAAQ